MFAMHKRTDRPHTWSFERIREQSGSSFQFLLGRDVVAKKILNPKFMRRIQEHVIQMCVENYSGYMELYSFTIGLANKPLERPLQVVLYLTMYKQPYSTKEAAESIYADLLNEFFK